MANPRKFSEKIALHKQRQAEEQASYERVLMEVRSVTNPAPNSHNPPLTNQNQPVMNCGPRMPHLQISPRMATGGHGGGLTPNDPRGHMWRSMPNIPAEMRGGSHGMPPTSANGNTWQSNYFDPNSINQPFPNQPVNQFQHNPYQNHNQPRMAQHASISNFHSMGGGGTQVYLEPPNQNWNPNQSHPNPPNVFQNRMTNLEIENGNILSRATSDSALHHSVQQKINDSKQKNLLTLNNKTQRKPESWSDFDSYERENSIRRLRPPQLTPQGAQSGSLPDLTNLHIPSSPSTPPISSNTEEIKRVESPATARLRRSGNPNVNQPQMNSPRQPRRPHPYVTNQRGYLGPGSSPSSPIATQPVNQRTSSLPSSPQQPKQDETHKKNCLSPSPVPEIVLTPSDTSDTSWGGEHPLQMNSVYQPSQQQFNNFDPNLDFPNLTNSNNHCGASNTFLSDLSNPYVPPTQNNMASPFNPFGAPEQSNLHQVLAQPSERQLAELLQDPGMNTNN